MRRLLILCTLASMALPVLLVRTQASPVDATRTGKPCLTCHFNAKGKELNLVGLYYKKKRTLAGAPLDQSRYNNRYRTPSDSYKPKYVPGRSQRTQSSRSSRYSR